MEEQSKLERKIQKYIETNELEYFDTVLQSEEDKEVVLALSKFRTGIFSWYPFKKEASVLEIGAGYGALTGFLSDHSAQTIALVETELQKEAVKKRWLKKKNLTVIKDTESLENLKGKFDYIVISDIFEDIHNGDESIMGYTNYVNQLYVLLREQGKILLLLNNRLGLQSFCGRVDQKSQMAFGALNQELNKREGRSFSKKEIEEILEKSQFTNYQFYYPFPNYELPQLIFSDQHLPTIEEIEPVQFFYSRNDTFVTSEKPLYRDVIAAAVFPFFANSFLVEIAKEDSLTAIPYVKLPLLENNTAFLNWKKVDEKRILENAKRLESEEEIIAHYRVSDKMKKIWKVELEMYDVIASLCEKHQIPYFFVHGSLLGAVRHQGFIPWDDDLDLAMKRRDYERFITIARNELPEPYFIHTPDTEEDLFWGGYAKVRNGNTAGIETRDIGHKGNLGIWIDILPLDICTMNDAKMRKKSRRIKECHRLLYAKIYGDDYERFLDLNEKEWKRYCSYAKLFSHQTLCGFLDRAMKLYTNEESEDLAFFFSYDLHRRLSKKDFAETVELEFENRLVPAPIGYENYFFQTMGIDYMKYPPKEERKPHHDGIFDTESSYVNYNKNIGGLFEGIRGKKIYAFGTGLCLENYMKKWGKKYKPDFLVDNDSSKWGRRCFDVEISSPEILLKVPLEKRHIIICSYYWREIEAQLKSMGIDDIHIYVSSPGWFMNGES